MSLFSEKVREFVCYIAALNIFLTLIKIIFELFLMETLHTYLHNKSYSAQSYIKTE